ncbi:hypothetical protein PQX77_013612 [Marasmius sp. AFHP31]|nr:hypothetical protein PQX77_013612 [Marasmius sp. AFHP31]
MALIPLSNLCLVILSGYVLNISYSPPSGSLKIPPVPTMRSPWPVWREYLLVRGFGATLVPVQRVTYVVVTALESAYIASSILRLSSTSAEPNPGLTPLETNSTGVTLLPSPTSPRPSRLAILGLIIGVSGCLLRIACYRALGNDFKFENTAAEKLVTTGPYSLVRHPGYLGFWLILIGLPWYHLSRGSWIIESGFLDWQATGIPIGKMMVYGWILISLCVGALLTARAGYEDMLLKKQFGREWQEWSRRVRFKVIPGAKEIASPPSITTQK